MLFSMRRKVSNQGSGIGRDAIYRVSTSNLGMGNTSASREFTQSADREFCILKSLLRNRAPADSVWAYERAIRLLSPTDRRLTAESGAYEKYFQGSPRIARVEGVSLPFSHLKQWHKKGCETCESFLHSNYRVSH